MYYYIMAYNKTNGPDVIGFCKDKYSNQNT